MYCCVTMHVNIERTHVLLEQDPNNLVVSLVASPAEWSVFPYLLSVLGLYEGIVLFITNHSLGASVALILAFIGIGSLTQIWSAGAVRYEKLNDFFVTVTGCPKQRVPSISLNSGSCVHGL